MKLAPVIPLCPTCRLWGPGSCKLHQPKRPPGDLSQVGRYQTEPTD